MKNKSYRASQSLCNYVIKVACEETSIEVSGKGAWDDRHGLMVASDMGCHETHIDLTHVFTSSMDRCYETRVLRPGIEVIDAVLTDMQRSIVKRFAEIVGEDSKDALAEVFMHHFKQTLSMVINQNQTSP